jgi:hypothetical protein
MDSLPLEIIANIARHIPKRICNEPDLPHLKWDHRRWSWDEDWGPETASESRPPLVRPGIASLSRKWQAALEPLHLPRLAYHEHRAGPVRVHLSRLAGTPSPHAQVPLLPHRAPNVQRRRLHRLRIKPGPAGQQPGRVRRRSRLVQHPRTWGHRPSAAVDLSISAYSPTDHCHRFYDRYKNSFTSSWIPTACLSCRASSQSASTPMIASSTQATCWRSQPRPLR